MAVTLTAAQLAEAVGVDLKTATRLLAVAAELVNRFAPDAPDAIANEAAIRTAGWLAEQPSAAITSETEGDTCIILALGRFARPDDLDGSGDRLRTLDKHDLELVGGAGVVFVRWGSTPGQPYVGVGPLSWAHTTARLQSEAERSLADEAQGPLAQLLAIPQDGGDDSDSDALKMLKSDIAGARGKALLVETSASGWGEGRTAAPQRDWQAARLWPAPPVTMATIRKDAFEAVLAACGVPPSLFTDADGTSQREAVRRWHLNLVLPLARMVEHELTAKLETEVRLKFDAYPLDLAGRAQAFQKLVAGGVAVNEALATSGLLAGAD